MPHYSHPNYTHRGFTYVCEEDVEPGENIKFFHDIHYKGRMVKEQSAEHKAFGNHSPYSHPTEEQFKAAVNAILRDTPMDLPVHEGQQPLTYKG
jgi:hypothetical protein